MSEPMDWSSSSGTSAGTLSLPAEIILSQDPIGCNFGEHKTFHVYLTFLQILSSLLELVFLGLLFLQESCS